MSVMHRSLRPVGAAVLAALLASSAALAAESDETAVTIYSSALPGAIPPELYRPVPGMGVPNAMSVPGYAMVRHDRSIKLENGRSTIKFADVAALIDPTTVTFTSTSEPRTRVLEQNFQFDLVSTDKLLLKYIDKPITVEHPQGNQSATLNGTLLSSVDGLVIKANDGSIHALRSYTSVRFPELPGGLNTKPTLVWDILSPRAGEQRTRVTYQTGGITWWADYNLVWTDGSDANHGTVDVGAWVSILNRSGTTYADAKLKLIAGDVNRVVPVPMQRARLDELRASAAAPNFAEQSFFEFHLYTLGRNTTVADNSTMQIELFPKVRQVPAQKLLVYYGQQSGYGFQPTPALDRNYGPPTNTKVDVYLKLDNRVQAGLGVPLPAGRVRVSQLDKKDDALEFIGENVIDHTPKDETVLVKLGSAFDVVGERRQVEFQVDSNARHIDETIEIKLRNHKAEPVDVVVREQLFRWARNDVTEASQRYNRVDARTVEFPVTVEKDGEATVRYKVRYRW